MCLVIQIGNQSAILDYIEVALPSPLRRNPLSNFHSYITAIDSSFQQNINPIASWKLIKFTLNSAKSRFVQSFEGCAAMIFFECFMERTFTTATTASSPFRLRINFWFLFGSQERHTNGFKHLFWSTFLRLIAYPRNHETHSFLFCGEASQANLFQRNHSG